jgi:hypothetical protein
MKHPPRPLTLPRQPNPRRMGLRIPMVVYVVNLKLLLSFPFNEWAIDSPKTKTALLGMTRTWKHLCVSSPHPFFQAET